MKMIDISIYWVPQCQKLLIRIIKVLNKVYFQQKTDY